MWKAMQTDSSSDERKTVAMPLSKNSTVFWNSSLHIFHVIVAGAILVSCRDQSSTETNESTTEQVTKVKRPAESRWKSATPEEMRLKERLSARNTSRLREIYRSYSQNSANSSVIKGTVTIRYEEDFIPTTNHRPLPQELPIELLPIWQRERVNKVRSQRDEIYAYGRKEAEPFRTASPEKKREWTIAWNKKYRDELNKLRKEEIAVMSLSAPDPTQEQIVDLLSRINGVDPELSEEDLPVIEYLLPPVSELAGINSKEPFDDQVVRLIEVHKLLSEEFPQSVAWGNKKKSQ